MRECPLCHSVENVKSGVVNGRQRYKCKACNYHFTVEKRGKNINDYYVTKALQLYLEGLSYREIERILGTSHVTVMNWVKRYGVSRPAAKNYHPNYKILSHSELTSFLNNKDNLRGSGLLVTELGDKFMLIRWERFRD